jgi:predicted ferric reductase
MSVKCKKFFVYIAFFLTLGLVCIFWLQGSGTLLSQGTSHVLVALGRLTGLLAVYFVLLELLTASRPLWLEKIFGLDKLLHSHCLIGLFIVLFLLAHPILLAFGHDMFRGGNATHMAVAGLVLFVFVIIVSTRAHILKKHGRSFNYDKWKRAHLFIYPAVILAFPHQYSIGGDFIHNPNFSAYWFLLYAFVFGNIIFFKILRPLYLFRRHRFYVKKIQTENHDVVSVYITGKDMAKFKIEPGQFITLRFLTAQFRREVHPFSISALPSDDSIRVSIKNLGDFTSQIKNIKINTPVLINGPYGILTEKVCVNNKILMIAGGIGIAPIRSLLEQLARHGKQITLLYCNRTENDIIFEKEIQDLSAQYGFSAHYILSRQPNYAGESGHLNTEKIKRFVPDYAEREIFLCGPEAMMDGVIGELKSLGTNPSLIHFEKFSF